ncbi:MAG: class I tRNA ligase family protein, partial [Actinomycetota bacterium]
KTLGNVVDPVELASTYGIDALRYFLLRRVPPTDDGDFTMESFIRAHNSDLADQLGNLLSRVCGMVGRYFDSVVPEPGAEDPADAAVIEAGRRMGPRLTAAMDAFNPQEALGAVWDLIAEANRYVVAVEPWNLAKRRAEDAAAEGRLATVLFNLVEALRLSAWGCAPFLPATAAAIATQISVEAPEGNFKESLEWGGYPAGTRLSPGNALFPKIEMPEQPAG